jgi:hypothetical protein
MEALPSQLLCPFVVLRFPDHQLSFSRRVSVRRTTYNAEGQHGSCRACLVHARSRGHDTLVVMHGLQGYIPFHVKFIVCFSCFVEVTETSCLLKKPWKSKGCHSTWSHFLFPPLSLLPYLAQCASSQFTVFTCFMCVYMCTSTMSHPPR